MATLDDVADWGSGGTPKRGVAEYFGEGTPWLSIADLTDGIVHTAKESLTDAGLANSSAKIVPSGTIFVAMYGSIGKLGIAGREMCTSQAIAFAKPNPTVVDQRYLFHFLLAQRPAFAARGRGGTQMNIGQGDLRAWPIPLPPLREQRRIAAILDHADAIRAKRRGMLSALRRLQTSVLADLLRSRDQTGWIDASIGDITKVIDNGKSPNCESRPAEAHEWGVLKLSAVTGGTFRPTENKAYLDDVGGMLPNEVRDGDILMTRKNTPELVGEVALVETTRSRLLLPDLIFRLSLDRSVVEPHFFQSLMMSPPMRARVRTLAGGAASSMSNISKARLRDLVISLPSLHLQREFAVRAQAIGAQTALVRSAIDKDASFFASLQARAFRGEL